MWTKAQDMPKDSADAVLERFDQTDPKLQRMIALQYCLDAINKQEYIDYLLEWIKGTANTLLKPEPYEVWRERTNNE
jgi:hypothetical protein